MKFISWNVNGLRAVAGKGFADIFKELDADFFCLQETKMQEGQLDLEFPGYTSYWNFAEKKGYSGTAIYSKHTPLSVTYGIGIPEHDTEGRVITLEMPDFYLVCVYVPNSQEGLGNYRDNQIVENVFKGIRPAVIALILTPTIRLASKAGLNKWTWWVPVVTALAIWWLGVSPVWIIFATILGAILYYILRLRKA